jgi:hypothetical protein
MIEKSMIPTLGEAEPARDAEPTRNAEPVLEIEIEVEPDGMEIEIEPEEEADAEFSANLAESLPEGLLSTLSSDLLNEIENDAASRKDWEKTYTEGLKLLGLNYEQRSEPWEGACGVYHPMITEAIVRFQSETITETFPAQGPVRTKIIGKETIEKKEAAARVEADMNFQLTEKMVEFRSEHERMLWSLPATGSAFKKVYFDPSLGRQISVFLPAEDVLLPYGTSDIQSCHRVTHRMRKTRNEIRKLQVAGFYRDVDLPDPSKATDEVRKAKDTETGFSDINDERYTLYEVHADVLLDEDDEDSDGIALPHVITLLDDGTVLSVRRNWRPDDDLQLKRDHFVHYQYIPGFGAYGFGLFHLIGGFAHSATSLMRQLVDAGTLSNLPGGLKSRGLRIKGDDTPISPGEFRDVDVGSGTIRDNILPLPYKEPSATLYNLLGTIVEEGRRFAATADMKVSDMSAQAPVGTTLALLERQLKVMTAVQARVHYALKQELKLIAGIIRDYADDDYAYEPDTGTPRARKGDFSQVDIIPVSDPNAATLSQRVVQYQAVIQLAQSAPQIYDLPQLHRGMLDTLGIKNAEKLVPLPDDQKPTDPVTENMNALKGKPLKAFAYQDHESHIQVHMAASQDPLIAQLIGQNPQAQAIMGAMMAHVAEHVGFAYRRKIEQQLGMPLPPEGEPLPVQVELALSGMMAQAANQVLQQSQQAAAQQQAQQQAQDPVLQMQQQELQLKSQELELKKQKMAIDAAAKADDLDIRETQVSGQLQLEAMKLAAQTSSAEQQRAAQELAEGVKLGIQVGRDRADLALRERQQAQPPKKPSGSGE